jgi:hypothetical protein
MVDVDVSGDGSVFVGWYAVRSGMQDPVQEARKWTLRYITIN